MFTTNHMRFLNQCGTFLALPFRHKFVQHCILYLDWKAVHGYSLDLLMS